MKPGEYSQYDAMGLADLVQSGAVTAAEVFAAAVQAIEQVNPELNAMASGPWAAALDYRTDGRFAGVPFALKDIGCHAKGVAMRLGSRLSGPGISFDTESFLVSKFRSAGLAILGLTTTPEFGSSPTTESLAYGPTRNPWDLTRSPGGSSGGAAVLVAAGALPMAHASDGGGSIRIPASANGLVGLKPSRGRVSHGPDFQDSFSSFAAEFAVTRTVRDCARLLDAVAGFVPGDKFAIRDPERPWSDELDAPASRLRIAVDTTSWSGVRVDADIVSAVEATGRTLESLGHSVESAPLSLDWDEFIAALIPLWFADSSEAIRSVSELSGLPPSAETLEHTVLASHEYGQRLTLEELASARRSMNSIIRTAARFIEEWDVVITPTQASPPLPLGFFNANDPALDAAGWIRHALSLCCYTPLFNATGTPALSVPVGWTEAGLPIGVQLAAPMCREDTLINLGRQLKIAMPWSSRQPTVHVR